MTPKNLVDVLVGGVVAETVTRLQQSNTVTIPPTVFIFKNGKIICEKPIPDSSEEAKQKIKDIIDTDKSEPDAYVLVTNVKVQIGEEMHNNAIIIHGSSVEWSSSVILPISLTEKTKEVKLGDPLLLGDNEVSFFDDIWFGKILFN